ncbi:hypothetical protein C0416_02050 [bacterium]|nr:hypothetical protein [bacterium]
MKERKSYILKAFIDPMIDTDLVSKDKPIVIEFLTRVREEATKIYDGNIDEKCRLIVDDMRYSISVVFKNADNNYLLTQDDAYLDGLDFPIASGVILPGSSSKVGNVLDGTKIKKIDFIGTAREKTNEIGAKNDTERATMPCYEALIDDESMENAAKNNGHILTVDAILNLEETQCSSKVKILQKHLADKRFGQSLGK